MFIGTIFTLFVLPAIYMLIFRERSPAAKDEDEAAFEELQLEPVEA